MEPLEKIQQLKDQYEHSESVWFLVDVKYRIIAFNKKAAGNSVVLHRARTNDSTLAHRHDNHR